MTAPFQTSRRVEFRDTDAAGIMHFTSIIGLMEEAEHEFLRQLEIPLFHPVDGGQISWPRVSATCDFKSPVRFEDVVRIDVVVQRLGKRSVTYGFQLHCEDRLVATGDMTSVCCLVSNGTVESVDVPANVAAKLAEFVVSD